MALEVALKNLEFKKNGEALCVCLSETYILGQVRSGLMRSTQELSFFQKLEKKNENISR